MAASRWRRSCFSLEPRGHSAAGLELSPFFQAMSKSGPWRVAALWLCLLGAPSWVAPPVQVQRRAALVGLLAPLPARAQVEGSATLWAMGEGFAPGPEQRMALYRGKVVALRESAEWYRFFVGDIVKRWLGLKASLPWPGRWARMRRTA